MNLIGPFLSKKYEIMTWRKLFGYTEEKQIEESEEENMEDESRISTLAAGFYSLFKAEEINHNKQQLQEALKRIELYQNGKTGR